MLRRRTLARWCLLLAVLCGGLGVALAFPYPAPVWLSIKGTGDDAKSAAYYAAISAPATFSDWKTAYGFTGSNDIGATYYNAGDLGFGREMHCRKNGADIACYVVNHALGAGAPAGLSVEAAIANQQTLAAVAMVYHSALVGQPNAVQFFIYNAVSGQRLNGVALDGQGEKFLPFLCLSCHGGTQPVTFTQVLNASFLPFDAGSFRYSGQAAFTQAAQADALRQLNAIVRDSSPSDSIKQLIDGWYAPGDVHNFGSTFHESFTPAAYSGSLADQDLYQNVFRLYCRSCHIAQTANLANPSDFTAARSYVFNSYLMPHAELTNHNFWSSGAPAFLADNRGWSLRVTRTDDPAPGACNPGDCSLREAILAANASSGPFPSIITFALDGTFTLSRVGTDDTANAGDLDITKDVTLLGRGPALTIIDANGVDRVFQILGGAHAVIQNVTIQGGGVNGSGGGILNQGSVLDLLNSVVANNVVTNIGNTGAGIANRAGAVTHIQRSTIGPANRVLGSPGVGGGLYNDSSTLTVDNATLTSNNADAGAALYNIGAGAWVTLTQVTVAENAGNGGVLDNESGATLFLANSLVTGNNSGGCVLQPDATYVSLGFNLVGNDGGDTGCTPGANDRVVAGSAEDVLEITPVNDLSGLIYHPLVPSSPAIDAIPVGANCALPSYDQRNSPRPADGTASAHHVCDIGAREFVRAFVTTNQDLSADDGLCSLREAVTAAGAGLASGLQGGECPAGPDEIILSVPGPYDLSAGELPVNGEVIVLGQGQTIRRASGHARLFHVLPGGTLNLADATLRDGYLPFTGPCLVPCNELSGGALAIDTGGTADILDSAIVSNSVSFSGGGIFNQGWLNLSNSTLSGNTADKFGGGLDNEGTVLLTNDTLAGNTADADHNDFGDGGGLATFGTTVFIKNSLVAGNFDLSSGTVVPDVYFDPSATELVSYDYNLIGDGAGSANHFTQPHDQVGTHNAPLNPLLGALTGVPLYRPLLTGSPAIDQIPPADCQFLSGIGNPLFGDSTALTTDQRGAPRPANATGQTSPRCDIGAFERTAPLFLPVLRR